MSNELTPKIAMLSALHFIITVVLLFLLDLGLEWFLDNVVFQALDWFNGLSIFYKLLILFFGGGSIFWALLQLSGRLSTLLGGLIFDKLPRNGFTVISSLILAIANAIWYIIALWKIPEHYDFWIVLELILLSFFIWSLIAIVIPAKEQIKSYRNEYDY